MVIVLGESTVTPQYIAPCVENKFDMLDAGTIYQRNLYTNECKKTSIEPLDQKVSKLLKTAYDKAQAGSSERPSQEYVKWMKLSPIPLHFILRYAVATGDTSVLYSVSWPLAKGFLYQAYLDALTRSSALIEELQNIASKTNNSSSEGLCNVDTELKHAVEQLRDTMQKNFKIVTDVYKNSLTELRGVTEMAYIYKNFEDIVFGELSHHVSKAVIKRSLKF